MIRSEVITDFKEFHAWDAFLVAYPELANETIRDAFNNQIKQPMTAELKHQPGQVRYPIEWESERQRRAFWATNGFGGGIPHRRTGKTVQGWKADIQLFEDDAIMTVSNPSKAVRYVTGDRQQKMHINTGWQPHRLTIAFWRDATVEVVIRAVRNLFAGRR